MSIGEKRGYFERSLQRGLLECVARMCIGLSDKVWLGYGEMHFMTDLNWAQS